MLDQCGKIFIKCSEENKKDISQALIEMYTIMYAGCSGHNFEFADDEEKHQITELTRENFCEISETNTGLSVALMDWISALEVIDGVIGDCYLGFAVEEEFVFSYPLKQIIKAFPNVDISGKVIISGAHCEDMLETYKTTNGRLIARKSYNAVWNEEE